MSYSGIEAYRVYRDISEINSKPSKLRSLKKIEANSYINIEGKVWYLEYTNKQNNYLIKQAQKANIDFVELADHQGQYFAFIAQIPFYYCQEKRYVDLNYYREEKEKIKNVDELLGDFSINKQSESKISEEEKYYSYNSISPTLIKPNSLSAFERLLKNYKLLPNI